MNKGTEWVGKMCLETLCLSNDHPFIFFTEPPTLGELDPPYNSPFQERVTSQRVAFPCPVTGVCWSGGLPACCSITSSVPQSTLCDSMVTFWTHIAIPSPAFALLAGVLSLSLGPKKLL